MAQKAGITILKGAVATALLLAGIPIALRCMTGPGYSRYSDDDTDWPETLEASGRMASGGAVVGGTMTAAVLLFASIEKDYPSLASESARRTSCRGCKCKE